MGAANVKRMEFGIIASQSRVIAVIGLGYLGLPVANGAARSSFKTVRFDIDKERVAELRAGHDKHAGG
jgi:UDP-N-acetyl-D-galactosamine dehydrogenase